MNRDPSNELSLQKLFSLDDNVAIVTGGGGLLGSQFCRVLASAGAKVVIADIDEERGKDLEQRLSADGHDAKYFNAEITNRDAVRVMVGETLQSFGRIDILINSAALDPKFDSHHDSSAFGRFEELELDVWNKALSVNLTGMFLCCQAVATPMLEQGGGSIINLCSTYGLVGPDQRIYQKEGQPASYKPAHYSVTKAGALGLTRYLAAYFAGKNIRVNALTPGGVYNDHDDEFVKRYSSHTILGRMARKDELNAAILFLASEASSYMTGSNLVVDGGWTAW
jgi:2-deoxy-D-gluconate 3-dehydrogenase